LLNKNLVERMEQALNHYFQKPRKLDIKIVTTELSTPAQQQEQQQAERQADATTVIKNDAQVKQLLDLFDATLDVDSIQPV